MPVVETGTTETACCCFGSHRRARRRHSSNEVAAPKVAVVEKVSIEAPATSEDASDTCKFFCPLCMLFHESLFKTTCCEQYACTLCIVEYLHSQQVGLAPDESAIVEKLPNVKCPYCATPVRFQKVLSSEAPRRYEDSPAVVRKLAARVPGGTYPSGQEPSPLKVGDTYEDMKRKMVPFEGANGPMSESDLALPTRSGSDNPLESSLPRALEMSFRRMPPLPESPDTPGHAGPGSPRSALSGGTPLQSPIAAVDSNAAEGAEAGSIPFGINSADESSLLAATPEHRGGPPSDTSLTPMSPNAVVPPSPAPIPNP